MPNLEPLDRSWNNIRGEVRSGGGLGLHVESEIKGFAFLPKAPFHIRGAPPPFPRECGGIIDGWTEEVGSSETVTSRKRSLRLQGHTSRC